MNYPELLPFFPLGLVAFPNEKLNLHIFEPRYKQLINECIAENKTFGIPPFINNNIAGIGTEMRVLKIVNKQLDGKMDIQTQGVRKFKIITFENPIPQKLYAGGKVEFLEEPADNSPLYVDEVVQLVKDLYQILQVVVHINLEKEKQLSYDLAHKIGLSLEQEYELFSLETETERQLYIITHLQKTIPIIKEIEKTKSLIRMNGHFKTFDPLDF